MNSRIVRTEERRVDAPAAMMVRFCLDRARECRARAEAAANGAQKHSWLAMEGRWFFLARSYDNERRLARFQ